MAIDFRKIILKRLAELGKSKYWLAEQVQENPSRRAIYAFLAGTRDMQGRHIAVLLGVLGLRVTTPSKR